jgi:hypothetical protein
LRIRDPVTITRIIVTWGIALFRNSLLAAGFAAMTVLSAQAATVTVFDDTFNADSDGVVGFSTVTELTNWNVTQGNVDALDASYGCLGCIDLDGTGATAPAILELKKALSLTAGTYLIQLFFSGGSQAEDVTLSVFAGGIFAGGLTELHGSGLSVLEGTLFVYASPVDILLRIGIGGPINNFGPYLDRVLVTTETAAVPLPAAAPLLLAGLGALGLVSARRRRPQARA